MLRKRRYSCCARSYFCFAKSIFACAIDIFASQKRKIGGLVRPHHWSASPATVGTADYCERSELLQGSALLLRSSASPSYPQGIETCLTLSDSNHHLTYPRPNKLHNRKKMQAFPLSVAPFVCPFPKKVCCAILFGDPGGKHCSLNDVCARAQVMLLSQ